jgi:protein SCO1/2
MKLNGWACLKPNLALSLVGALLVASSGYAYEGKPQPRPAHEIPKEFEGVGISERLGVTLDLTTEVVNEAGQSVPLGAFFDGKTPVILSLVYYSCPALCNLHLNGLIAGLREMDWSAGEKFRVIALSFDSKEGFETAAKKKVNYLKEYNRPGTDSGWNFLTASQASVEKITQQVGFDFKWNNEAQEWAHASAAIVLTPGGKVSRYLHGVAFDKGSLKLALSEATDGKIGNLVDRLVMYCFMYDPKQSKYTLAAFRLVQLGGGLMVVVLAAVMIPFWMRSRRERT